MHISHPVYGQERHIHYGRLGYGNGNSTRKKRCQIADRTLCGAKYLGEALRRIGEGVSMIGTNSKLTPSEPMQDRGW